jgi:hypothetical protein
MGVVVTFSGFTPAPRADGLPWTSIQVNEGTSISGPWTLRDTLAISPVDADPAHPQERTFTTEEATLEAGWYKIVFADADGDTSEAAPIFNDLRPNSDRPSVDDVAQLLRTRTVGDGTSTGLGADTGPADLTTFDQTTRPSASEVDRLIETATGAMYGRLALLPEQIPATFTGLVRHVIALYTALLIEQSYFRESADESTFLANQLDDAVRSLKESLAEAPGIGTLPVFAMGTLVVGTAIEAPDCWEKADPIRGIDY